MSGCCSKNSQWMHSPLKTMLGKIGNRYQTYCIVYKMHTMATCHRVTGCPVDRDINLHIDDPEATGMDNDNESISGSDATVALDGLEAEGNPKWTFTQQSDQVDGTHMGIKQSKPTSRGQRRTTSWKTRLHRKRATKSLSIASTTTTPNANTYWAIQRSDTPIHQYLVYHTKADKSN